MCLNKKWDILSPLFNTHAIPGQKIDPIAADNIDIAWPVILEFIKKYYKSQNNKILDLCCGDGSFCNELIRSKFTNWEVYGFDFSEELLKIAKLNTNNKIIYKNFNLSKIHDINEKFDSIICIHGLEFIENLEIAINNIHKMLNEHGIFIFAIFTEKFVNDNFDNLFSEVIPGSNKTFMVTSKGRIPIYIRKSIYYDQCLKSLGLKKIDETQPIFTKEFIKKYKPSYSTTFPEFDIFVYKKLK